MGRYKRVYRSFFGEMRINNDTNIYIYIYQINISTEGSCIQACDQTTWRGDASCGILGRPIDLVGYESPTAAMTAGPKLCADIFDFSFFLFF